MLRFVPALLGAALIAGCTSADPRAVLNPGAGGQQAAIDPVTNSEVIQGTCPQVVLREGTAYYRQFAKGGDGDPAKIMHQASISDTTRQCRISGDQMIITVAVSGRVVTGPAGKAGTVEVPVRVAVIEGENVLYSDLQKHPVTLLEGMPAEQFIFTNSSVTFPAASARSVKLYVGFDPGPYDTP
ncbi:lipoprotein [Hoeflea sp. BAL378]|nr:lipoprotein [Hoeflea sp. BAL378]